LNIEKSLFNFLQSKDKVTARGLLEVRGWGLQDDARDLLKLMDHDERSLLMTSGTSNQNKQCMR
jgi:hypothetical protein